MLCLRALKRFHSITLAEATAYCKSTVRKFDFPSYVVAEFLPKSVLPVYFGINAFYLEVLKAREISTEMHVCQTRLLWWVSTLEDIQKGIYQQEPISVCLHEALQRKSINPKLLYRLVDYQLFDMEKMRVRSMKDLEIYGENTRSLLLYMTLHMIGIDDDSTYKAASHLGMSMGICDVLKRMQFYLTLKRSYIPDDIMEKVCSFTGTP